MPEYAPCAARGRQRRPRLEQPGLIGLDLQSHHTEDIALGIAHQVQGEELVEELGARGDVALVQGMQNGVPGAVVGGVGPRRRRR